MTTLYAKPFHKKMRRLFCLLAALLVFAACDKPKNIPDDKLTAIVGDLFLANAYWDIHGDYRFIRDSIDIYSPIFEQYGFTPKDFMFTITFDGQDYGFSFDQNEKPQGLDSVKDGDTVMVTYTGTVNTVDAFTGKILSVEKVD